MVLAVYIMLRCESESQIAHPIGEFVIVGDFVLFPSRLVTIVSVCVSELSESK